VVSQSQQLTGQMQIPTGRWGQHVCFFVARSELDEIANYGLLKNMFELVGGDFQEASPAEVPASERPLTSTASSS
jgi:hypothetical protein